MSVQPNYLPSTKPTYNPNITDDRVQNVAVGNIKTTIKSIMNDLADVPTAPEIVKNVLMIFISTYNDNDKTRSDTFNKSTYGNTSLAKHVWFELNNKGTKLDVQIICQNNQSNMFQQGQSQTPDHIQNLSAWFNQNYSVDDSKLFIQTRLDENQQQTDATVTQHLVMQMANNKHNTKSIINNDPEEKDVSSYDPSSNRQAITSVEGQPCIKSVTKYSKKDIEKINKQFFDITTRQKNIDTPCDVLFTHFYYFTSNEKNNTSDTRHYTVKGRVNIDLTPDNAYLAQLQIRQHVTFIDRHIKQYCGSNHPKSLKFPNIWEEGDDEDNMNKDYVGVHAVGMAPITIYFYSNSNPDDVRKYLQSLEEYLNTFLPQDKYPKIEGSDTKINDCKRVSLRDENSNTYINLNNCDVNIDTIRQDIDRTNTIEDKVKKKCLLMLKTDPNNKRKNTNRKHIYNIIRLINHYIEKGQFDVVSQLVSIVNRNTIKKSDDILS